MSAYTLTCQCITPQCTRYCEQLTMLQLDCALSLSPSTIFFHAHHLPFNPFLTGRVKHLGWYVPNIRLELHSIAFIGKGEDGQTDKQEEQQKEKDKQH